MRIGLLVELRVMERLFESMVRLTGFSRRCSITRGDMRQRNVYDFTEIVGGFYAKLASEYENDSKNSLTKRVLNLVRRYVETDPRHQSRMDQYAADF